MGYNNVHICPGDEWKAAFKTNRGMFEPLVMFFGLMNSPTMFQAMMNELFKDLIASSTVFIYMDDILIATCTMEEHRRVIRQVLQILKSNQLFLKPEKCEFEKDEVEYLGIHLQAGQLAMDPIKLQGIADWPTPAKLKDIAHSLVLQVSIVGSFAITPALLALSMISLGKPPPGNGENQNKTLLIG